MGNGKYEEFTLISGYVCNGLFSTGEDGFGTRRMTSFYKLFGRCQASEREFHPIRDYLCTKDAKFKGGWTSTQCLEATVFCRSHGYRSPGLVL